MKVFDCTFCACQSLTVHLPTVTVSRATGFSWSEMCGWVRGSGGETAIARGRQLTLFKSCEERFTIGFYD
jgi:hypothetical protein